MNSNRLKSLFYLFIFTMILHATPLVLDKIGLLLAPVKYPKPKASNLEASVARNFTYNFWKISTASELEIIPGISSATALKVFALQQELLSDAEREKIILATELEKVKGLGAVKAEQIAKSFTVK